MAHIPTTGMGPLADYWIDAFQRSVLFLDTLRERGNTYHAQVAKPVPHVLGFEIELVMDGHGLARPVNYGLVRIVPPAGTRTDETKPPVVVVDPRAGHGPGIGGMKQESEIGEALAAGHACYFIGFTPTPMPGQTIEDVCAAEALFLAEVARRHAHADGKPIVIANCQAGWQMMMTAALHPDLPGPILLAGAPLSYWAGVRGKNPLRYLGGMLGGTWLTALAGDLGHGIFDGAALVANFESMNPANTYWKKAYNLYSKVDTETARFLDFETWWGNPVLLNAQEMQWIADNLFVGNRLATGQLRTGDGTRIDLRNIQSPIVVFCSWGDDITPPQQALGWVLDLYESERDLIANGQTIVYTLHQSIGHLGIFVSGKVASKEHGEFVSCMDMIDTLPPGLYEAVIAEVGPETPNPELINGRYLMRLEARSLADIRVLGGNDAEDERRFATVARVSDINLGMYRTLAAPMVRAAVPEQAAETLRAMHPNRLRFGSFSDRNPAMVPVKMLAGQVRAARRPVSADNPFLMLERMASDWIVSALNAAGEMRDMMTEALFLSSYGNPVLQALVGLGEGVPGAARHIEHDLFRHEAELRMRAELEAKFESGTLEEAALRALIYVALPSGAVDERGFNTLKLVREAQPAKKRMSMADLKRAVREQYLLVRLDEARAVAALPKLLGTDAAARRAVLQVVQRVVSAKGVLPEAEQARLRRVRALLAVPAEDVPAMEGAGG